MSRAGDSVLLKVLDGGQAQDAGAVLLAPCGQRQFANDVRLVVVDGGQVQDAGAVRLYPCMAGGGGGGGGGVEPPAPFDPLVVVPALFAAGPFRNTRQSRLALALAFGRTIERGESSALPWRGTDRRPAEKAVPWGRTIPRGQSRALPWSVTLPASVPSSSRWRDLDPKNIARSAVWSETVPVSVERTVGWGQTVPVDPVLSAGWNETAPADRGFGLPFLHITDARRQYAIPWGFGRPPPTIWKPPPVYDPDLPTTPGPGPVYVPPRGDQVALPFNCGLFETRGDQVELPFRRFQCLQRHFSVDNDISITRVDTAAAVAATSVRLGGDLESFSFSFSASMPRAAGLEIVDPTDGPVEVEVNVNGQVFLCLVESWSDDRTWSGARRDEITVQGRSIVAELDDPYFPPRNYPRGSGDTSTLSAAGRMVEEIPLGSGWAIELDPAFVDWPIPAGSLVYSGLTPIRAIALIAQAAGAVVQHKPDERVLRIMPRFAARPWRIGDAPATAEIYYSVVTADRGQWLSNRDSSPRLGVFVEGDINGVSFEARIAGTAGEWADPVLEPLCTDNQAALARAVTELGQSWRAALVGLQIPMGTQGAGNPGWVAPGQVVQVFETAGSAWKGISTSWEIAGRWDDSSGLVIDQRVTLERYLELNA